MAEGILAKHIPAYDHFSMNNIPKGQGSRVVEEWRCVAGRLADMSVSEVSTALNLAASYRSNVDSEVASHRIEISLMLRELADACHAFYERSECVCVLGM